MAFVIMQNYFRQNPHVEVIYLKEIESLLNLRTIDIQMGGGQITEGMVNSVFDEVVISLREQDVRLSKATWDNIMNIRQQCAHNNKFIIGLQAIMIIAKTSIDELERFQFYIPPGDIERRQFRSHLMEIRLKSLIQDLYRPSFDGFTEHVSRAKIVHFLTGRWAVEAIAKVINSVRPNSINIDGVKKCISDMKIYYADRIGQLDGFVVMDGICLSGQNIPRINETLERVSTCMLALNILTHYVIRRVFNKYQLSTPSIHCQAGQFRINPNVQNPQKDIGRMVELMLIGGTQNGYEIDWNNSHTTGADRLWSEIDKVGSILPLISLADCGRWRMAARDFICVSQGGGRLAKVEPRYLR